MKNAPVFFHLNNSFIHGLISYSVYASSPLLSFWLSLALSVGIGLYSGWHKGGSLFLFLTGIVISVAGWVFVGIIISPEVSFGALLLIPVSLPIVVPIALLAYATGKAILLISSNKEK